MPKVLFAPHLSRLRVVLPTVLALVVVACATVSNNAGSSASGGSGGGTGKASGAGAGGLGTLGSGGSAVGNSGANGAGGSCSSGAPCGGNLIGRWEVASSCLSVSGDLDLTLAATGCKSAPVTGSLQVTGTFTANADGTYLDETTTTGTEHVTLAPACLVISSTPVTCAGAGSILVNLGYKTFDCTDAAGGGCNCTATVNQAGGLGVVSVAPTKSSNYAASGNVVTISGDAGDTRYSYCASSSELTLAPQGVTSVTGSIVFHAPDTSGAGGRAGSGGNGAGGAGANAGGGADHGGAGAAAGAGGSVAVGGMGAGGAGGHAASGGAAGASGSGAGGSAGASGASGSTQGPCDIYKSGGTPCVAAHSTVRALFGAYGGKLYQVRNSAGTTQDINAVAPGGVADASKQDAFCSGTTCVVTVIYDQSGTGNDLAYQGSGSPAGGQDKPASATRESINVSGKKVYSLYIAPSNSYWVDASKTIPTGSKPEGLYMVTSGKHFNSGCCFDYGNSETDRKADGGGTMDAINFSNTTAWGTGAGSGPWVMADLEYGIFTQGSSGKNNADPSQTATFVTGVLKNNGTSEWALKGGDASSGGLSTYYKGALPAGWSPMKKQGAIVLGSGGDCCATNNNLSEGTFYEGALVAGYPSDATEDAIQANIVAAGYGK